MIMEKTTSPFNVRCKKFAMRKKIKPARKRAKPKEKKMNLEATEVVINNVVYVPKSAVAQKAEQVDGLDYVIVRTTSAGVFAGYMESKEEKNVVLRNARRLWYWIGAASLSQLAVSGTSRPSECKFPCEVPRVELTEAIEILDVTAAAKKSISEVKVWQA